MLLTGTRRYKPRLHVLVWGIWSVLLLSSLSPAWAGNRRLIEGKIRELDETNRKAVQQIPNLPQDGRVDLKARVFYRGEACSIDLRDYRVTPVENQGIHSHDRPGEVTAEEKGRMNDDPKND